MSCTQNKHLLVATAETNNDNCPLDGECLTPIYTIQTNIIYHADITTDNDHKFYYGKSETTFKERHSNHTRDFTHVKYQHASEIAKYNWYQLVDCFKSICL